MKKPRAANSRRKPVTRQPAQLPAAVEGHVAELCRDIEVQVKRMRELQQRAEELRLVIQDWAGQSGDDTPLEWATPGEWR